jgi:hypothetical protein
MRDFVGLEHLSSRNVLGMVKQTDWGAALTYGISCIDNPGLCSGYVHVYKNPSLRRDGVSGLRVSTENSNSGFYLGIDHRRPKVCMSCTPIPKNPEKGIALGDGWLFELRDYPVIEEQLILRRSLLVLNRAGLEGAFLYSLNKISAEINRIQAKESEVNEHFSRAPEIMREQIEKAAKYAFARVRMK